MFRAVQTCIKSGKSLLTKAIVAIMLIVILSFSTIIFVACNDNNDGATLLFSDEFNSSSVNLTNWSVYGTDAQPGDPGTIRRGGWWTSDSVFIGNGNLVIRTTYDEEKNTFYTGGVYANELMTYGYYEARCKVPEARGMWAAFWIMCDGMGLENPDATVGGAEIDIFESPFYAWNNGLIQHAIHTGGYGDYHQNNFTLPPITLSRSEGVNNGYEEWHTFALDWQPDGYKFYVDGVLTWETTDPNNKGDVYLESNVSSVPSYMILSVEVGGTDGIPGNADFITCGHPVNDNKAMYDMSNFSVDFLIDYVKVWDRNPYTAA